MPYISDFQLNFADLNAYHDNGLLNVATGFIDVPGMIL